MKGIDVSSWQGKPNWERIKLSGVQFAILRCHQKTGIDSSFSYNYINAKNNGMLIGAYKLSYATTIKAAEAEAYGVLEVLKDCDLDFPVYYDLEDENAELKKLPNSEVEAITEAFLNIIQNEGYKVGIYCNMDWYDTKITNSLKEKYDFWIATIPFEDDGSIVERLKPTSVKNLQMWQYSFKGKVPGINGDVDMDLLIDDDVIVIGEEPETVGVTAEDILKIMRSWIGLSRAAGTHKIIIDTYNSYLPHPRGYAVTYTDDYCDTTVSAAFVKAGDVNIIGGIECGVEEHVQKFIKEGIWIEDGTIVPKVGDIITYNWDKKSQPNNGFSDHIGIVESVGNGSFTTIEGNMTGGVVGRRVVVVGDGCIRGFARPKYAQKSATGERIIVQKTIDEIAREVIAGKWSIGADRVSKLIDAGYNPAIVQLKVNDILAGMNNSKDDSDEISKTPKFVGKVTASKLNVRTWAGTENPRIKSYPSLSKGNLVDVCDTVKDTNGADWYYVKIAGQFFGFVSAQYVERA